MKLYSFIIFTLLGYLFLGIVSNNEWEQLDKTEQENLAKQIGQKYINGVSSCAEAEIVFFEEKDGTYFYIKCLKLKI